MKLGDKEKRDAAGENHGLFLPVVSYFGLPGGFGYGVSGTTRYSILRRNVETCTLYSVWFFFSKDESA